MILCILFFVFFSHFIQLGFDPLNKNILTSRRLQHEVGQGKETNQTREIKELQADHYSLGETCYEQYKC